MMTTLATDILKALSYYDVFSYPLTIDQIVLSLPSRIGEDVDMNGALDQLIQNGHVKQTKGYYFLSHQPERIIQDRLQGELYACRMWKRAQWMTMLMKRFPFVRGIYISGELSKNLARQGSDLDYLIVTVPHRLWIARTFLILFKKIVLLNNKQYFCLNLFISEDQMTFHHRSLYSAIETATLQSLWNARLLEMIFQSNLWIRSFLPNWNPSIDHRYEVKEHRSLFQSILEGILEILPLDKLDQAMMRTMQNMWRRRYPDLPEEKRNQLYQCSSGCSSAYGNDFEQKILHAYHQRLDHLGLQS